MNFLARLFSPRPKPVSQALAVEAGVLETKISGAIAAIDQVHTDGALPHLPVKQALLLDMYGYFLEIGGKATEIAVSLVNPHIELTTIHEVGHFLDSAGLDTAARYASVNSLKLDAWQQAVKRSQAAQSLRQYMSPSLSTVKETLPDGSVVEYIIDKKYVDYLLKAEELWSDADFQPIMLEIEAMFKRLAWM